MSPRGNLLLRDVATVRIGPEMRRGIAELDGEGEVAGGVIVLKHGDIPNLAMPGMTMGFDVADRKMLD